MTRRYDPAERLVAWARRRATKRGIDFTITRADISIPRLCPMLGIPLYRNAGAARQGPHSPSLDRIDNTKGYVPGNVIVVSARANSIKGDATPTELLRVAMWSLEHGAQPE